MGVGGGGEGRVGGSMCGSDEQVYSERLLVGERHELSWGRGVTRSNVEGNGKVRGSEDDVGMGLGGSEIGVT
ncbi:unnamed protein product [Dovyalis caffra]|uniref:Uncharacterized protein n=1 Tax=Dovyalis caffra TaxID=77055 RepID=A0AAV1QS30_9ROSI|nr:unnamed protein product [Dovyalis caffra]